MHLPLPHFCLEFIFREYMYMDQYVFLCFAHTLYFFLNHFLLTITGLILYSSMFLWIAFLKSEAKKIHLYFSGQNELSRYFIFSISSVGLAVPQFTFNFFNLTFINTQSIVLKVNFIERFLIFNCVKNFTQILLHMNVKFT